MRWEHMTWVNGRHGTVRSTFGKSKAAKRILPMSPRVRQVLEARWIAAGEPEEGWVWPAPTQSGHVNHDSLKRQHRKALRISQVRPFEVYSIRHTFATRLAPHLDAWTLMRIMGWSSIAIAMRYVHMSDDRVLGALAAIRGVLGGTGDKSGDSQEIALKSPQLDQALTVTLAAS